MCSSKTKEYPRKGKTWDPENKDSIPSGLKSNQSRLKQEDSGLWEWGHKGREKIKMELTAYGGGFGEEITVGNEK